MNELTNELKSAQVKRTSAANCRKTITVRIPVRRAGALGRGTLDIAEISLYLQNHQIRGSIVVSIPACHAGDPGSIPGRGVLFAAR